MTSFAIYGLNNHELMPLEKVFKKPLVGKVEAITAERPIDHMDHLGKTEQFDQQHLAERAYSIVKQLPKNIPTLMAEQVMTSPVVTLMSEVRITEVLRQFQTNVFRHFPVVSSVGKLVGIISDRDIFRYLAGLTESYQPLASHTTDAYVEQLMVPRVLTASVDTDVRYIARLFVEQHIGAIPITKEGELKGIITRSDVLGAVIRHYTLDLWA